MKDSPAACATLGMDLTGTKLAVFAFSAAMAGVGGALYAGAVGNVSADRFNFFQSLPLLLLAVVGGIGAIGGAVFAGMVLYAIPLVTSTWNDVDTPLRSLPFLGEIGTLLAITPGLMGIGLGKNPDGVVRDLAMRFEPLRTRRGLIVGLLVVLAGLVAAAEAGALSGWWFGLFAVVAIFGAPGIAMVMDRRDARLADDTPLEWLGIDRPFTEDDVRAIDAVVALPQGAPR
jgi:hypothetical protein